MARKVRASIEMTTESLPTFDVAASRAIYDDTLGPVAAQLNGAQALVVAPSDDRLIPVEHAKRYAERIAGASYAEVADCGHAMYFERPAEFASTVTAFLNAHPLATAESGVSR